MSLQNRGMLTSSYSTRPNQGLRSSSFWAIYIIYHYHKIFTKFEAFSYKMSNTLISCLAGLIYIIPLRPFFSMKLRFLFCVSARTQDKLILANTLYCISIHSWRTFSAKHKIRRSFIKTHWNLKKWCFFPEQVFSSIFSSSFVFLIVKSEMKDIHTKLCSNNLIFQDL